MQQLRRVGILSVARTMAILYGLLGLVFVPVMLFFMALGQMAAHERQPFGLAVGLVFLLLMPLMYAAMGFIGGALGAWIYNLVAGWFGGIELEFGPAAAPASMGTGATVA